MIGLEEFLKKVICYNNNAKDLELISKAYLYANKMHEGQKRKSGEDYFIHPLSVAFIMLEKHADADTIAACLLHDVVEDTTTTLEEIESLFGSDVSKLVDGVTKIKELSNSNDALKNAMNTRKIITSLSKDIRIIEIKLADRLHNMRTLQYMSEEKQKRIAKETMDIYVPLAYNLGEYQIKSELEDLSFLFLNNDAFCLCKDKRDEVLDNNKEEIIEMMNNIKCILEQRNINITLYCRIKNIYGTFKKIEKNGDIKKVHDLISLVIVVDSPKECYLSLMDIHNLYKPINSYFKDYICNPKNNLYQSLHTTLFAPNGTLIQIQIRTKEMDLIANHGLTAYYKIDFNNAIIYMQAELSSKLQFYKSIVQLNDMENADELFVSKIRNEVLSKKIYVFNEVGKICELPEGATIIDYAFKAFKEQAYFLEKAFVNEELVQLNTVLNSNDIVHLEFNKDMKLVKDEWIDYAITSNAKKLILGKRN